MEATILPVFEVELDLDKEDPPVRKAEVEENSGVHLRCKVKGKDHDPSGLQWMVEGSVLSSKNGIRVETDHSSLVSDLKMNPVTGGIYECGVNKADGKFYKTRLRVATKPTPLNQTLFGEVSCGPEKRDFCQNGGTCLYHPGTKAISCRCPPNIHGERCEYLSSDGPLPIVCEWPSVSAVANACDNAQLLRLGKPPPMRQKSKIVGFLRTPLLLTRVHACQSGDIGPRCEYGSHGVHVISIHEGPVKSEYHTPVILTAGVAGFFIIALVIVFLLYVKKRDQIKSRFSRRERTKDAGGLVLRPPTENVIAQSADCLLEEGQALEEPTLKIPVFRPSPSMEEKIKLIKALIPARCPHCKKKLGINARLDALYDHNSTSSRSSTPPLLSYRGADGPATDRNNYHTSGRSVSESYFRVQESNGKTGRFHSNPGSYLRVTEFLPKRSRSAKERARVVSERAEESLADSRCSVSTPASPVIKKSTALKVDETSAKREALVDDSRDFASNRDMASSHDASQPHSAPRLVAGTIQEMSVDESDPTQDSTAQLDALQSYRAQNKPLTRVCS